MRKLSARGEGAWEGPSGHGKGLCSWFHAAGPWRRRIVAWAWEPALSACPAQSPLPGASGAALGILRLPGVLPPPRTPEGGTWALLPPSPGAQQGLSTWGRPQDWQTFCWPVVGPGLGARSLDSGVCPGGETAKEKKKGSQRENVKGCRYRIGALDCSSRVF